MSIFRVFLVRIQSKCGKIPTRKTPNTDTFLVVLPSIERMIGWIFTEDKCDSKFLENLKRTPKKYMRFVGSNSLFLLGSFGFLLGHQFYQTGQTILEIRKKGHNSLGDQ